MARRRGMTFEEFREIAMALPGVEEGSSYGTPGFRVKRKFMARLREDDVMVLKPVEDDEQRFLMETQPQAFFLTDHYRGYPAILIRLSKADREQVRELIAQAWRRLAPPKLLKAYDVGGDDSAHERGERAGRAGTREREPRMRGTSRGRS